MRIARSLAAAATLAAAALAPSAASAQVFSTGPWSGLYIGAHGGYSWESGSGSGLQGGVVGGQVGYNLQLGAAVLGVEADYSWSQAKDSAVVPGLVSWTAKIDSMWSVRGRLGAVIGSNVMVYGTAGYGGYDVALSGRLTTPLANGVITGSAYTNSFVLGAGAELLLTRNIMLRAEALHYTSGAETFAYDGSGITTLRVGASYKF